MMNSAAQREEIAEMVPATGTEGVGAVRQMAVERLAAHRSRRAVVAGRAAQVEREQMAAQTAVRLQARRDAAVQQNGLVATGLPAGSASRVRDAVAARYLQSQSYREFLAIEAQRALEQAQAEAEVAARSARAVAEAQRQLLDEIEHWNQPHTEAVEEPGLLALVETRTEPEKRAEMEPRAEREPRALKPVRSRRVVDEPVAGPVQLQVRMHEELQSVADRATGYAPAQSVAGAAEEMADLDDEIEFRLAPEFQEMLLETQAIQANIIEFPRQLVASRKVRPRLAEGPLLEETAPEPQLRIFEVEAELVAAEPEVVPGPDAPVWQSLRLAAHVQEHAGPQAGSQLDASGYFDHWLEPVVYAAPVTRRMMSAAVDAAAVLGAFGGAAFAAAKIAGDVLQTAPLPVLGISGAVALLVFGAMYRLLFFTLNEATPGMRAMRLAFCTFDEKSPSRKAVRRRMMATVLSASPLGMGLLWMVLDSERLGWHDRMSRMYPRSY